MRLLDLLDVLPQFRNPHFYLLHQLAYRDVVTTDKDKKEEETRSLVYLKNGEMQEYGILENGETYLVSWYLQNKDCGGKRTRNRNSRASCRPSEGSVPFLG